MAHMRVRASLRAWIHTLPSNVLVGYMLELRDFDEARAGVAAAVELLRIELQAREAAPVADCGSVDVRIRQLVERCRAQQQRVSGLRDRSELARARLEAATQTQQELAFAAT